MLVGDIDRKPVVEAQDEVGAASCKNPTVDVVVDKGMEFVPSLE